MLAGRAVVAALEERGLPVEPALRAAGLTRAAFKSVENRLPHANVAQLWEAAATLANDPSFGAHVAERLPLGAFDVYDYLCAASADVGEAIARIARYQRLLYDRLHLTLVAEPRHARVVGTDPYPTLHFEEFLLTLNLVRTRQASGVDWTPERMQFQHQGRPRDGLTRIYRCPIAFGARKTELRFAAAVLKIPFVRADSRLLEVLTRYADKLLAALPARGDLVARVRGSLVQSMHHGLPNLAATAAAVRLRPRTLQRRLAMVGATYSNLVDEVRREFAFKHLADAALCLAEVGFLLHFADQSSFFRAFRRWTGETPAQYRARLWRRPARR